MSDPQLDSLRIPPHSVEAEQAVLGGLLIDNAAWDRVADYLTESDFYRYDHRLIYQHIGRLIGANRPADVITVFESLEKIKQTDDVGGLEYINNLAQNTPSAANIRRYAEIVHERGLLRKLVQVSDEISSDAFTPAGRDAQQILDSAEAKILGISEEGARGQQGFISVQPLLAKVVERVEQLYGRQDQSEITGLSTSFIELDRMTTGLQNGDLVIVAGRPSMGKTAFAMNIAEHAAIEQGLPVAVFSMEMSGVQLVTRMLGTVGRLDQQRMRTGRLTDDDWSRLTQAMEKVNKAQIYVDETPALNSIELRSRARRLSRECGSLGLIVIDYLQLMSAIDRGENRATEISEISRNLKALAKELDCPVVALSQLNRSLESRPNKRPIMSDLRESGAIEQDADLIIFIYRDEVYNKDTEAKGVAEIIVGKQRNGPIGDVRLTFLGQFTKFENYISGERNDH